MIESCPGCSGRDTTQLREHRPPRAESYHLHECSLCHLQFWSPLVHPTGSFYEDESLELYTAMHAGERDGASDPRFSHFLRKIADLPRERSVLDIGCADGALLRLLQERGFSRLHGIEIDRRSVRVARERGLDVTIAMASEFAERCRADSLRFDVVCMFDVLEHVTDPVDTLAAVRSMLEPGGTLIGTVPNRNRIAANLVLTDFPPHHFLRFDARSIQSVVERAGFRDIDVEVFEYGYAVPVIANAVVKRVRPVRVARSGVADSSAQSSARSSAQSGARPSGARPSGGGAAKRLLRRGLSALTRAAVPIERAVGRGFKLYFSAKA